MNWESIGLLTFGALLGGMLGPYIYYWFWPRPTPERATILGFLWRVERARGALTRIWRVLNPSIPPDAAAILRVIGEDVAIWQIALGTPESAYADASVEMRHAGEDFCKGLQTVRIVFKVPEMKN